MKEPSDQVMHTVAMYDHIKRMQKRIMAHGSYISWASFTHEPYHARVSYYNWMRRQCGELADLI